MQNIITVKMSGWLGDLRPSEKGDYARFDYIGGSAEFLVPSGNFKQSDISHCFEFEVRAYQTNLPLTTREGRPFNVPVFRPDTTKGFITLKKLSQ